MVKYKGNHLNCFYVLTVKYSGESSHVTKSSVCLCVLWANIYMNNTFLCMSILNNSNQAKTLHSNRSKGLRALMLNSLTIAFLKLGCGLVNFISNPVSLWWCTAASQASEHWYSVWGPRVLQEAGLVVVVVYGTGDMETSDNGLNYSWSSQGQGWL